MAWMWGMLCCGPCVRCTGVIAGVAGGGRTLLTRVKAGMTSASTTMAVPVRIMILFTTDPLEPIRCLTLCTGQSTFYRTMSFSSRADRGTRLASPLGPMRATRLIMRGEDMLALTPGVPRRPPSVVMEGLCGEVCELWDGGCGAGCGMWDVGWRG